MAGRPEGIFGMVADLSRSPRSFLSLPPSPSLPLLTSPHCMRFRPLTTTKRLPRAVIALGDVEEGLEGNWSSACADLLMDSWVAMLEETGKLPATPPHLTADRIPHRSGFILNLICRPKSRLHHHLPCAPPAPNLLPLSPIDVSTSSHAGPPHSST